MLLDGRRHRGKGADRDKSNFACWLTARMRGRVTTRLLSRAKLKFEPELRLGELGGGCVGAVADDQCLAPSTIAAANNAIAALNIRQTDGAPTIHFVTARLLAAGRS
jgi:hypothetical protein